MAVYLAKSECRGGQWNVVVYDVSSGELKELFAVPTGQPCGEGQKPPQVTTEEQPPPPAPPTPPAQPEPKYACVLEADPAQHHHYPSSDKHVPEGFFAKLFQTVDLLSDEPAGFDGCDWGYKIECDCQSTDSTFTCTVKSFGFVYHALGNSIDDWVVTYAAKLKCSQKDGACTVEMDDSGAKPRHVGSCLTVDIQPTWTVSGNTAQVQVQLVVALDASASGNVAGPGGGSGGSATFPGAQPGFTQKVGTYKWTCSKWQQLE